MAFKKLGAVALTGLIAVVAFIVFSPKHESSGHDTSIASSSASQLENTSSNLDPVPKGEVVAEQLGAVICPNSKTWDAFDAAWLHALTKTPSDSASKPNLKEIWLDIAKPNGCNYVLPGTPLVSDGGTSGSKMATVTEKMPDGTITRGVTQANMLYSVPKGNLVAADFGAIICPDSKAITAYKDASTAWSSNNQPNMSAEEYEAAAKGSVEVLAKSAGCNYVVPGTSLVSEGGVEGGHGYGANLNLSVTAQMPDGTTIRGLTLPIMTSKSQQQPTIANQQIAETNSKPPTAEPETQQADVKPTMGQLMNADYLNEHYGRAAASACEASADNFLQGARSFDWAGFTWDTGRAGKKFDSYRTDAPFGQPIPGELAEISHNVKMLKTDGSASSYQITLQCNYSTGGTGKVIDMGISQTYVDGVLQP